MAGLEYRASIGANSPEPAPDLLATNAYYTIAKSGDPVVLDGDGKVVGAAAGAGTLFGVCLGRELALDTQADKYVKVYTSGGTRYQVTVAGDATVEVGGLYNLNADKQLNASAAGTALRVVEINSDGNVFVVINKGGAV